MRAGDTGRESPRRAATVIVHEGRAVRSLKVKRSDDSTTTTLSFGVNDSPFAITESGSAGCSVELPTSSASRAPLFDHFALPFGSSTRGLGPGSRKTGAR